MQGGEKPARDEAFHFSILQSADVDAMIHLIATSFSAAEPPAVAMGLSAAELSDFLKMLAPRAVDDGLTVVARSSAGEIVGALLTDDFSAAPPLELQRLSPRFLPILAMLDSLDEQYRSGRLIGPGQYLHLFMIAVDEHVGGRGIAQRLVEFCLENGGRKGYRYAVTEATGVISQRVFRKLGFDERHRILYGDFLYGDKAVFAGIAGHTGVVLMEKRLDS